MKTITALMAIAALGLAACGSSGDSSSSSSSSGSNTTAASSGGGYGSGSKTTSVSNSKSVKVQMYDNYFGPKTITGKPGSTITVELKNVGQTEHNFKIDGQKAADADVKPGEAGKATVKIPASGSVQFYCEYHKGLGMVGTVKSS